MKNETSWLVFDKNIQIFDEEGVEKNFLISIVYKTAIDPGGNGDRKIVPIELGGKVSIYFPTAKEVSNLFFHINAPFASTVARDSVRDCPQNNLLRDNLVSLFRNSVVEIQKMGLLSVDFLGLLPNKDDNLSNFYAPFRKGIIELFKNEKLIPLKGNGYGVASDVFEGDSRIQEIITDSDFSFLKEQKFWIINPKQKNQREHKFLHSIPIASLEICDFIDRYYKDGAIFCTWLKTKNNNWHRKLYNLIAKNETWLKKNANLRIVKNKFSGYVSGAGMYFTEGNINDDSDFPSIDSGLFENCTKEDRDELKVNLKKFGVKEVNELERIKSILDRRYKGSTAKEFSRDDFYRFVKYSTNDIGDLFKNYYIILDDDGRWKKPEETYSDRIMPLKAYFDSLKKTSMSLVSSVYFQSLGDEKDIFDFLKKIGVVFHLPISQCAPDSNHPDYYEMKGLIDRPTNRYWEKVFKDYKVKEIENIFQVNISTDLAKCIFSTFSRVGLPKAESGCKHPVDRTFNGESFKSSLSYLLQNFKWVPQIVDDSLKFVTPKEATRDLLPKDFQYDFGLEWLREVKFEEEKNEHLNEVSGLNESAKRLDFKDAEEARRFSYLLKELAQYGKTIEDIRKVMIPLDVSDFPTGEVKDPSRRIKKLEGDYRQRSERESDEKIKNVRISKANASPTDYLRSKYSNDLTGKFHCQICHEGMSFVKRDAMFYFEAVEIAKGFKKESQELYLALCPLCSAKYKEFVKNVPEAVEELLKKLKTSEISKKTGFPLSLEEGHAYNLRFVESHLFDVKNLLVLEENE